MKKINYPLKKWFDQHRRLKLTITQKSIKTFDDISTYESKSDKDSFGINIITDIPYSLVMV